jgi:hypothetical protein
MIIDREVVGYAGKITLSQGAERWGTESGEAHCTITRHPETRPIGHEAA